MDFELESSWQKPLRDIFASDSFNHTLSMVKKSYDSERVFPPQKDVFKAFLLTPFTKVKVVILGQDPYHGFKQAHGLAFSVPDNVNIPPSLQNIYKEIAADLSLDTKKSGNLEHWSKQGVLLLNTTLTVCAGRPNSHRSIGWETLTDEAISKLSEHKQGLVFMLWGNHARSKVKLIDAKKHLILTAPHPSPLSAYRGFLGCRHFSQCNQYLKINKQKEIIW